MALSESTSTPTSQSLQPSSHISSEHLTSSLPRSSSQRPLSFFRAASYSKDSSVPSITVPARPVSPSSTQHRDPEYLHDRPNTLHRHHSSTIAIPTAKPSRGGLFSFAALAREKTSSAIAGLAEPSIRSRRSSGSLYRTAQSSPVGETHQYNTSGGRSGDLVGSGWVNNNNNHSPRTGTPLQNNSHARSDTWTSSTTTLLSETDPPSQAYCNTATDTPAPIVIAPKPQFNKMHQTSSRLLRMTSDERPFTRVHINLDFDVSILTANQWCRTLKICFRPWLSAYRYRPTVCD